MISEWKAMLKMQLWRLWALAKWWLWCLAGFTVGLAFIVACRFVREYYFGLSW